VREIWQSENGSSTKAFLQSVESCLMFRRPDEQGVLLQKDCKGLGNDSVVVHKAAVEAHKPEETAKHLDYGRSRP
jgi:hypothetical protein